MDAWAVPDDVDVYYLTPTRQSWRLGDREITCVFGNADERGTLTGSLRKDETTLDADQFAYLKAAHILNAAMDSAPDEEYVEDDLPGHKKWAQPGSRPRSPSRPACSRDHRSRRPPRAASPPWSKDLRTSREEWAKAADAPDADTFYDALRRSGVKLIDADTDGHHAQGSGARHHPALVRRQERWQRRERRRRRRATRTRGVTAAIAGRKCLRNALNEAHVITSSDSLAFACMAQPTVATLLLSVQPDGSGQ